MESSENTSDGFAHTVLSSSDLESKFRSKKGKLDRIALTSGQLSLRIVKIRAGEPIDPHGHTKRMDKFLLKGKLIYEDKQEVTAGSWAKLSAGRIYNVKAVEDSHLLLVERAGTRDINPNNQNRDYIGIWLGFLIDIFEKSISLIYRIWRPALIMLVFVAPSAWLLYKNFPKNEQLADMNRNIALSLLTAFLFLVVTSITKRAYRSNPSQMFRAFALDDFCIRIRKAKHSIRIYSTYSDLFLEQELWTEFKRNAVVRLAEDQPLTLKILLIDPNCEAVKQRAKERKIDVAAAIAKNISNLKNWLDSAPAKDGKLHKIEVRISDSLPRHQHHQIDEEVNFSFYPRHTAASQAKYVKCSEKSEVGQFAIESFDDIWNDDFTLDLHRYFEINKIRIRDLCSAYDAALKKNEHPS